PSSAAWSRPGARATRSSSSSRARRRDAVSSAGTARAHDRPPGRRWRRPRSSSGPSSRRPSRPPPNRAKATSVTPCTSASWPACAFLVLEALLDAGRQMGLPPQVARRLAEQTLAGSAALAAASPDEPAELRRHVTSPGGTTEEAVAVLETRGVRDAFVAAVLA